MPFFKKRIPKRIYMIYGTRNILFCTTLAPDSQQKYVPFQKSTWTEHIWSTFIHRGYSDDVTEMEPKLPGKEYLTAFQIDKFKYFFYQVLDQNSDHVISEEDFIKLNDRIRHYMDWSVNEIHYLALKEVHDIFKVIIFENIYIQNVLLIFWAKLIYNLICYDARSYHHLERSDLFKIWLLYICCHSEKWTSSQLTSEIICDICFSLL